MHRLLASTILAAAGLFISAGVTTPALAQSSTTAAKAKDVIVFRNGNQVEGEILEETATSVRIRVVIAGIAAETTYERTEIQEIRKAAPAHPAPAADPKATEPAKPAMRAEESKPALPPPAPSTPAAEPTDPNAPKVYIVHLTGEFGRDTSATPMEQVVADVKKFQPDVLVLQFDNSYTSDGQEVPEFLLVRGQYDQLETARQISTLLTDQIRDDAEWSKKPRLVGWVKKALGGAAFIPFVCPELYFSPDAHHGGIGNLEHLFDGVGDEVAREKQYSLRMKRAEGLAEKGGYDGRIMRAMSRTDYILSYRLEGGKPVYLERMPEGADEFLLTDDGKEERKDILQDIVRLKGNDALVLDAVTAQRIGVSKGTAATEQELMFALGLPRNYVILKGKGDAILKDWSEAVTKAEANINRLVEQYNRVEVKEPGGYTERTAARGQRKRILIEVRGILDKYKEAINPRKIRNAPEQMITDINILIDRIEQEQRLDKRR